MLTLPSFALVSPWLQHAVAGTAIEAALFRAMSLPGVSVLFPRPPAESVSELNSLVAKQGVPTGLLLLRARQEESALELSAAERDLKAYAAQVPGDTNAGLELADFYHRRLAVQAEFDTLLQVGGTPAAAGNVQEPLSEAQWQAFERALRLATDQSLPATNFDSLWQSWIARYPRQTTVYARAFTWNLNQHRAAGAQSILDRYRRAFPSDTIFPVKASALVALVSGGPDAQSRALGYYNSAFQPLWPKSLTDSYFDLLASTHQTRRFVADAQAALQKNPEDLNAAARLFLFYRHDNHPELASAVLDAFRRSKEQRDPTGANWSAEELYTLAQLSAGAELYAEAARYNFALYHAPGKLTDGGSAQQAGLTGMISLLLTESDQPIALGSSNLGMYRDIGALDQGPGFWNGVLSLWLNTQGVSSEFDAQETRAQPYFHRSKAAALLRLLDKQAPTAPQRAALHAQLIDAYAAYGEDSALLQEGERFLQSFPKAPQRTAVALAMADADARGRNTTAEFAVYDRLLDELGRATDNMPLSTAAVLSTPVPAPDVPEVNGPETNGADDAEEMPEQPARSRASVAHTFDLDTGNPSLPPNGDATAYAQVLDRYLARLTATNQLQQALGVLRKELDRNPNDPKLYERLADFLAQNNLSAQQEEVYRVAIAKFNSTSWYDKLARFYVRQHRRDAFAALTRQVTDTFSGTDLEAYFRQVREGGPQVFLELNIYAHRRFPHDLAFTQNLLNAYNAKPTNDRGAWEHLLRESWWQSPELTTEFFAWLSQTGQLDKELTQLETDAVAQGESASVNTAPVRELAEGNLWRSHFEQSTPLFDRLAALYPTDQEAGTTAADLHRSLAWLDAAGPGAQIKEAVADEQRLLKWNAADQERLIRIGDILADHADGTRASYAESAAFWRRVPTTEPGSPESYLQAATVFWDYFQFDDALEQIRLARTHFGEPSLFGYEAGAILEGKGDVPEAIQEYVRSVVVDANTAAYAVPLEGDRRASLNLPSRPDFTAPIAQDPAADRLLQLARRSASATLVDKATAGVLDGEPTLAALRLRLAVLTAQHRREEEHPLIVAAIERANTTDAAADLAAFSQAQGDTAAYEAALKWEAHLTPDPVEALQLTYDLVRSYQARHDLGAATTVVDATYRANPRRLGVVRFTVDFDWSNKREKEAVRTLLEASRAAQPSLATSFIAEAAGKANESGDWTLARSLASQLLTSNPYDARFLALAAESYTRAGDNNGLQGFYRARLNAIRSGTMTSDERRMRTALLRRGLITALIAGENYPEALDQYTFLIASFPDDSSLIREAALFALKYQQADRLRSFYVQTTQASPRDARFFVALAQTEDSFGDPTSALAAYTHAVALRPERSDLYIAKASLEERLQRFDAAVADYTRLFQLSYHDPQWMVAAAQAQARQGHTAEVVQALEAAYLHGAQTTPHDLFTVAKQLAQWGMITEAMRYAERGATLAGPDLLAGRAPAIESEDPGIYAGILTRARRTDEALATLSAALAGTDVSPSAPRTVAAQARASGLASVTDAEWRRQYVQARRQRAEAQFTQAAVAMGEAVAIYGTPEDRSAFAGTLAQEKSAAKPEEVDSRWIPVAHAADLGELEASWRAELLNSNVHAKDGLLQPYISLQQSRVRFAEMAAELDRYSRVHPKAANRAEAVRQAANAYAAAGEIEAELRLLGAQRLGDPANVSLRGIYLDLLAHCDTNRLVALAGSRDGALADAAASAALAGAPGPVAMSAIRARGTSETPLWTAVYTGLTGLYLDDRSITVDTAFRQALVPDATIGERLSSRPDSARQLTGDPWFYNAARYGQWRLLAGSPGADDLLPAEIEQAPTPASFLMLADTEAEGGLPDQALEETGHALELAPGAVDALDARAELLWKKGQRQQAVECWRTSLTALRGMEEHSPVPEGFWTGFQRIALRTRQHGLFTELQPSMNELLRSYLARNGSYRSNELLASAIGAAPEEATGLRWVMALSGAASDPSQILQDLAGSALPASAQMQLLSRALEQRQSSQSPDANAEFLSYRSATIRSSLLKLYIENRKDTQALALIQAAPKSTRLSPEYQTAALIASARSGQLHEPIKSFDEPGVAEPSPEVIRSAAATLANENDWVHARTLLEWAFAHAMSAHALTPPDYLTVAEARIHTDDTSGAIELLRLLVTASQNRYTDEDSAATLLESARARGAAIPFLKELTVAVPWELSYRVRLGEAQRAANVDLPSATESFVAVAQNGHAPYALRARAARDLSFVHGAARDLGSAELNLLSSSLPGPGRVQQPMFVEARLAFAAEAQDPKLRLELLREAIGVAPYLPDADKLRLQMFELAAGTDQTAFARALLDGMLASQNENRWPPPQHPVRSGLLQYLSPNDNAESYGAAVSASSLPLYGQVLPAPEQAKLAQQIAKIQMATKDQASARAMLQLADKLLPADDPGKAHIANELASLDAEMRLAAVNASRRPTIHKELDQPAIVRVRLNTVPDDFIVSTSTEEP